MPTLKVSLRWFNEGTPGCSSYSNKINATNYKEVALLLLDLESHNMPIQKAIQEFLKIRRSDWDILTG